MWRKSLVAAAGLYWKMLAHQWLQPASLAEPAVLEPHRYDAEGLDLSYLGAAG